MKVSESSEKLRAIDAGDFFAIATLAIGLHVALLLGNAGAMVPVRSVLVPERKAVVLCASQKTLGVAVAVIELLPESYGDHALLVLPCIIGHFAQIILDALVAAWWVKRSPDSAAERMTGAAASAALPVGPAPRGSESEELATGSPVAPPV